ncbi:MAG: hypothetical protein CMJ34_15180 [Phycisphaerae bacterium]|nr:hypothetical protein [Phycisphaerae bacterium]
MPHQPLHRNDTWIDGHLDLAWLGVAGRDFDRPPPPSGTVSWPTLRESRIGIAFGTIFTQLDGPQDDPASYPKGDRDAAARVGRTQMAWYESMEGSGRLRIARTLSDLDPCSDVPAVVLLMECADPIVEPDDLEWWVDRGLRLVGLSWALGSRHAGGNAVSGGLTAEGRDLVEALEARGVGHDLSHLSRKAFDDLMTATTGPVCATHSNAASIIGDDPRHLTDEQYSAIADRDGIVGLNLFGRFLARDREATLEDCLDHVEHAAGIIGRHRVALGSDADGGFGVEALPVELRRLENLPRLAHGLEARGWSSEEIAGFRSGNWRRWLEELPALRQGR